jgi:hypothetical protein
LKGGAPNDGYQLLMTSYRSEVGGIASGLSVIDTLVRSGKIKVKSVRLVCDNEASVKVCTRKRTQNVFHRTKDITILPQQFNIYKIFGAKT